MNKPREQGTKLKQSITESKAAQPFSTARTMDSVAIPPNALRPAAKNGTKIANYNHEIKKLLSVTKQHNGTSTAKTKKKNVTLLVEMGTEDYTSKQIMHEAKAETKAETKAKAKQQQTLLPLQKKRLHIRGTASLSACDMQPFKRNGSLSSKNKENIRITAATSTATTANTTKKHAAAQSTITNVNPLKTISNETRISDIKNLKFANKQDAADTVGHTVKMLKKKLNILLSNHTSRMYPFFSHGSESVERTAAGNGLITLREPIFSVRNSTCKFNNNSNVNNNTNNFDSIPTTIPASTKRIKIHKTGFFSKRISTTQNLNPESRPRTELMDQLMILKRRLTRVLLNVQKKCISNNPQQKRKKKNAEGF